MSASRARRDWLAKTVSHESGFRLAGIASTFALLRSLMLEAAADVALIDVGSDVQSTTTREWLVELLDLAPVVILTSEQDPEMFDVIRRAGTGALLHTNASSEQIILAIKSVAVGLTVVDAALSPPSPDAEFPVDPLTPREIEVLRLLADGLGNKDIAQRLNISEHTIKFHIHSILAKLGAASRTEAVTRGLRSGLIEL